MDDINIMIESNDMPNNIISISNSVRKETYIIISKVAYLIGVPKWIFENVYEPPKLTFFNELEQNKNARIIRDLCRLRTAIQQNLRQIDEQIIMEGKGIYTLPDLVPTECIERLYSDGIKIVKSNCTAIQYLIKINELLSDRINNCKDLFPLWLNWAYIREIFIMPCGLNEEGVDKAVKTYYENKKLYPYRVYINWTPADEGNILFNDKKFITLLYRWNKTEFSDFSKVSDAGNKIMLGIYDFLKDSKKTVLVVDCENSDPYRLCAALRSLDEEALNKISKIILYDDVHSASAWKIIDTYVNAPVERTVIKRVKQNKSLVDISLTGGACREYYKNNVDSFIIASSDSDYWGLISSLPEARFLVMVEHEKFGPDIKAAFINSGIFYCYLDNFNYGKSDDIRFNALVHEIYNYLNRSIHLNVNKMMEEAYKITRVNMSDEEKNQFYHKFIKPMHLVIDEDGNVSIELKSK